MAEAYRDYMRQCYQHYAELTSWNVDSLVALEECLHSRAEERYDCKQCHGYGFKAPAGYCFVDFADESAANLALHKVNGKKIPGSHPSKRFKLNYATYGREHHNIPEYSLYVGDLSSEVDDLMLYETFAKRYPSCRAAKVVTDSEGRSKGYGFLRFTDDVERRQALYEMQRYNGLGRREIRLSLAVPKRQIQGSVPTTNASNFAHFENQNYYWNHYQNTGYYSGTTTTPSGGYWPATYPYYGYDQTSTQPEQAYYGQTQQGTTETNEDDFILEDPGLEIDIDAMNKEFIEQSEELYVAMEGSRWHPLDTIYSRVVPEQTEATSSS